MGINKLSLTLANHLAERLNYDEEEADVLRYGFEVLIGEVIKITVLVLLSLVLGIFPYVLLITFFSVSYRSLSGGIHFNTYGRCFVFSLVLILSLGKISQEFGNIAFPLFIFYLLAGAVFLISFYITLKYAPVDSENKPLSKKKKKEMKKLSLIWLTISFIVMAINLMIVPIEVIEVIRSYIIAVLFGILVQALGLLPVVSRTVTAIDLYLDKTILKRG